MAGSATELLDEFKRLRKGRAVQASRLSRQVGPNLRVTCGITEHDGDEMIRQKLTDRLSALVEPFPADLALAARVALGLHPAAQQPFLGGRVQWLAEQLSRDQRTARRRMDDALVRLAQAAAGPAVETTPAPATADDRWYVAEFHALLRLDQATPEAIERRTIVAEVDGIDHIEALITLPRDPTNRAGPHDLHMEVLYGATLVSKQHHPDSRFRYLLKLPTLLRAGDRHEYALLFRVPRDQLMRTHYVFTSPRRCDLFDLRIRFDPDRLPDKVWRVANSFHRTIDDRSPTGDTVALNPAGELHLQFHTLKPGFGYGAQWTDLPSYDLQHSAGPVDRLADRPGMHRRPRIVGRRGAGPGPAGHPDGHGEASSAGPAGDGPPQTREGGGGMDAAALG